MKKKLPVIIAFILTIAAAFWFAHIDKADRIYNNNVDTLSYVSVGVLENGEKFTQTIVCREDIINGFQIKNSIQGEHESATVRLEVRDAETDELIAVTEEPGSAFRRQKIHKYNTEQLTGMAGRKLKLSLTETGSSMGSGIIMYYVPEKNSGYKAELDGNVLDGVMPAATVTERFDTETFIVFLLSLWFIWGFMWFLYRLFQ